MKMTILIGLWFGSHVNVLFYSSCMYYCIIASTLGTIINARDDLFTVFSVILIIIHRLLIVLLIILLMIIDIHMVIALFLYMMYVTMCLFVLIIVSWF